MKVLFLKDVPGTAARGDVKEVALGFARNYLFPRRLATHVTPNALTHVEKSKVAAERRLARVREDPHPSVTMMDLIEANMRGDEVRAYAEALLEKVTRDRFPSLDHLRRLIALG